MELTLSGESQEQLLWAAYQYSDNKHFLINISEIAASANTNPIRDMDECYRSRERY